jgi:NOL1/NOP2/fmu family ribosome biogenesis protein
MENLIQWTKKKGLQYSFMLSLSVDSRAKSKSDELAHENSEVTKLGEKPH